MTEEELKQIRKRWEATSEGPWYSTEERINGEQVVRVYNRQSRGVARMTNDSLGRRKADAAFIAQSWQDIKSLLDEVEHSRIELDPTSANKAWEEQQALDTMMQFNKWLIETNKGSLGITQLLQKLFEEFIEWREQQ